MHKQIDQYDIDAEREHIAISNSYQCHTQNFGKRLKRYHYIDGEKYNTGQKHRAIGRNY